MVELLELRLKQNGALHCLASDWLAVNVSCFGRKTTPKQGPKE